MVRFVQTTAMKQNHVKVRSDHLERQVSVAGREADSRRDRDGLLTTLPAKSPTRFTSAA